MTAMKTLALGVLVMGAATQAASGGPYSGSFTWTSWNAGTGVVQSSGMSDPFQWGRFAANSTDLGSTSPASTPAPAPAAVTISSVPTLPTASPVPAAVSSAPAPATYDAFVNLSNGNFADSGTLTNGSPQPWYNSPVVSQAFSGTPNGQQQAAFTQTVLADVQRVFDLSNVPIHLTSNPSAPAAHTLSVVSGTSYAQNPDAIGITNVGADGFDFIDKFGGYKTPESLAIAISHNIAHELMHAFGISTHHDTTGTYIDSGTASSTLLTDPNATFSPAAVKDLLSRNFTNGYFGNLLGGQIGAPTGQIDGDQVFAFQTVPEPSTVAVWAVIAVGLLRAKARRGRRNA